MRVLLMTQLFKPEPDPKSLPLAKGLQARGHEVEVLTGFPNYPGGKLYPGYAIRPWQRESIEGIAVTRVALFPSHDRSGLRRMLNYLSFAASSAVFGIWLVRKPDVIYVYNLVTLAFAAFLLRALRGGKVVLDVQDLWPESVATSGMMRYGFLLRLLQWWSDASYRWADRVTVISPGFKQRLIDRGIPAEKIDVVYNWCDEEAAGPIATVQHETLPPGFGGHFNVVFAGTMGVVQGLDTVIASARQLREQAPEVKFTFVGGGVDVDRLKSAAASLPNVQFLPRRSRQEIGEILQAADVLLVHLKDDPTFRITIPSKIQAYMHAARPILCGVSGDAAEMVERAGAGLTFAPDNAASLTSALLKIRSMGRVEREAMGAAGQKFYQTNLSVRSGVDQFEKVFESIAA